LTAESDEEFRLTPEQRTRAFDAVERATDLPMLLLSLALVPLLIVPMIVSVPDSLEPALLTVEWLIWAAFAMELIVKTYLAPARWRYLRNHWFDLVVVLVPILRPLRVVRSVRALRLLRLLRIASLGAKAISTTRAILAQHGLQYVLAVTIGLVLLAAAAVTYFERHVGGTITDFPTALWWAATTITTVGYGDTYPVAPEGRGIGVLVMLVGITVFGLLTANVAAFFVETHQQEEAVTLEDVMAKLDALQGQLASLQQQMVQGDAGPDRVGQEPHRLASGKR
jgi:voltage-gated potassium channel